MDFVAVEAAARRLKVVVPLAAGAAAGAPEVVDLIAVEAAARRLKVVVPLAAGAAAREAARVMLSRVADRRLKVVVPLAAGAAAGVRVVSVPPLRRTVVLKSANIL